jgi:type II secretory pathway pseudopilin PulG
MRIRDFFKGNGGFTLLEAMIATSVLAVGLLTSIYMVAYSVNARRTGKDVTIANNLVKEVVEGMKTLGYKQGINLLPHTVTDGANTLYTYDAVEYPDPGKIIFPDVIVRQTVRTSNKRYHVVVHAVESTPKPELATVDVFVNWTSASVPHGIKATTYFNMNL